MQRTLPGRAVTSYVVVLTICPLLTSCATPTALHEAAARGDASQIDRCMKRGMSVNAQDEDGNTPLHHAYYHNRTDIIDRLIAYGADPTIRNNDGDTPSDVRELGRADNYLRQGAELLDRNGSWKEPFKARPVYDELKSMDGELVTKAIVRKVIRNEDRMRVLLLAVRLGIPGSEDRLNEVLQAYGDEHLAEDYLNCGSPLLYEGGQQWANARGYTIKSGMGSHRVSWGRF
jgi:hypothetical protein